VTGTALPLATPQSPQGGVVLSQGGNMAKPTEQQIRARAHELWEQAGKPDGREDEFWQQPTMLLPG